MKGVGRLWSGELPLQEAFWTWAVVVGLVINVTTSVLFLALMLADWPIAALVLGYGFSVPYNVIAVVGVWRSADRYPGDRRWADLARIAVVLGMVLLSIT